MKPEQVREYQRRELIKLIRQVSANYGGDDEQFLNEYIAEVLDTWKNDLPAAVKCFTELAEQKGMNKK